MPPRRDTSLRRPAASGSCHKQNGRPSCGVAEHGRPLAAMAWHRSAFIRLPPAPQPRRRRPGQLRRVWLDPGGMAAPQLGQIFEREKGGVGMPPRHAGQRYLVEGVRCLVWVNCRPQRRQATRLRHRFLLDPVRVRPRPPGGSGALEQWRLGVGGDRLHEARRRTAERCGRVVLLRFCFELRERARSEAPSLHAFPRLVDGPAPGLMPSAVHAVSHSAGKADAGPAAR